MVDTITNRKIRTYTELIRLKTFEERFNYLALKGAVGFDTFGIDRYLNQMFYKSGDWGQVRDFVITRDLGNDLAMPYYEIDGPIYVHHMNPLEVKDITLLTPNLLTPEFLVCCSFSTHNAVHYGSLDSIVHIPVERRPNDTCPWRN